MRIEQVMTKHVGTVRPGQSLSDAAQIMWERDCGCVPVVSDAGNGGVVGMLTDRDICMAAYTQGKSLGEIEVRGVMSPQVHSCKATDSLEAAESVMRSAQVRRLPVVDDSDQLIGIVCLSDLARVAARCRAQKKPAIGEAEVGDTLAAICQPREIPGALATA